MKATNRTDTEASEAFFGDPEFMHSDILSESTKEYLQVLFSEPAGIYICMAQIFIIPHDHIGNHKRLRSAVKKASKEGADLICFPDAVVSAGNKDPELAEFIPDGKTFSLLSELAKTYQIWYNQLIYARFYLLNFINLPVSYQFLLKKDFRWNC